MCQLAKCCSSSAAAASVQINSGGVNGCLLKRVHNDNFLHFSSWKVSVKSKREKKRDYSTAQQPVETPFGNFTISLESTTARIDDEATAPTCLTLVPFVAMQMIIMMMMTE